jgi:alpha-beta hydrolase superfamily lysophospholipase
MEFNIKLSNGQILRGMIQSPGENLKAVIVMVHGIGEHIHRYDHWAAMFNIAPTESSPDKSPAPKRAASL